MNEYDDKYDDQEEFNENFFDSFKDKVNTLSSLKLCEIIVCNRYLGFYREESILAMKELADRRINGDQFDFESNIETHLSEMPKLDFQGIPDFRQIMTQALGKYNVK